MDLPAAGAAREVELRARIAELERELELVRQELEQERRVVAELVRELERLDELATMSGAYGRG